MAFLSGYTKRQKITIDNTKVLEDLTDYPVYVDLSDLDQATDIFDTCKTDGGDIRITKSDGTTELAREVVVIDTTAKTGELHFKYAGTLSSTVDTDVYIYYNGTSSEPASTATYGSEAVWSDYELVIHMQEDPSGTAPQMLDSSANNNDGTSNGGMTSGDSVAGKLAGKALDFDSTDYISIADSVTIGDIFDSYGTAWTMQFWVQTATYISWKRWDGSNGWQSGNLSGGCYVQPRNSASNEDRILSTTTSLADSAWHFVVQQNTGSYDANDFKFRFDGVDGGNSQTENGLDSGENISNSSVLELNLAGIPSKWDEVRIRLGNLSNNWLDTDHNNQNSPSTFYSTATEETGVTSVTVTPTVLSATFSIPTPSVVVDQTITPSTLSATFTLNEPTVIISGAVIIVPTVLTATFSIQGSNITAVRNVTIAPTVLSATFSIVSPSVVAIQNVTIIPDVLSMTMSINSTVIRGVFWQDKFPVLSDNWSDKY